MEEVSSERVEVEKLPWYRVMWLTYFSPSLKTYQFLSSLDNATTARATVWMVIAVAITYFSPGLLYWVSGGKFVHDDFQDVLRSGADIMTEDGTFFLVSFIMAGLFTLFLAPVVFQINVGIVNWLANKLGGSGDSNPLGFLLGAILAPGYIGDSIFESFALWLGIALRSILILAQAVLIVIALRTTKSLSLMRAIGVLVIVGIAVLVIVGILFGCFLFIR